MSADDDLVLRQRQRAADGGLAGVLAAVAHVPVADPAEHDDADHGDDGEPGNAVLAERKHDEGSNQRADCLAGIAADLEEGLRKAMTPARSEPRHARGFRVEDGGTEADQAGSDQQQLEIAGIAEQDQAAQRARHADRQGIGHRPAVGDDADEGLQQRGGDLEGHRQKADLDEVEIVIRLEERVERSKQRLHDIVQHVAEADGHKDRHRRLLETGRILAQHGHGHSSCGRFNAMPLIVLQKMILGDRSLGLRAFGGGRTESIYRNLRVNYRPVFAGSVRQHFNFVR